MVTCATCGQVDVPVGLSTLQAYPHRVPGACCQGISCGHYQVHLGPGLVLVTTPSVRELCPDHAFEPGATDYGPQVEAWEAGATAA